MQHEKDTAGELVKGQAQAGEITTEQLKGQRNVAEPVADAPDPEKVAEMPPCITREQALAHIMEGASTCPACGYEETIYGLVNGVDGRQVTQKASCDRCGAAWMENYELYSITDRNHENAFSIHDDEPDVEKLRKALETCRAALYHTPGVGEEYDEQHSECHTAALMEIAEALGDRKEGAI